MAVEKYPALQFYPGDWKRDAGVQSLSLFERAVWFELLLLMHDSEERGYLIINGKPISLGRLARLLGEREDVIETAIVGIKDAGVCGVRESDGAIFSRRMVRDEKIRHVRAFAGSEGGKQTASKRVAKSGSNGSKTQANGQQNTEDEDVVEDGNEVEFEIQIKELDTPEIRDALSMFASKLAAQNRPLNQITLDPMLGRYAGRPEDFLSALLYSASRSRCVNLIDPPQNERGSPKGDFKSRTERNQAASLQAAKEVIQEAQSGN